MDRRNWGRWLHLKHELSILKQHRTYRRGIVGAVSQKWKAIVDSSRGQVRFYRWWAVIHIKTSDLIMDKPKSALRVSGYPRLYNFQILVWVIGLQPLFCKWNAYQETMLASTLFCPGKPNNCSSEPYSEWLKWKTARTPEAGEDAEKLDHWLRCW